MHGFAALLMAGLVAASGPVSRDMVRHVDATASDLGEVYVAELDADWNVAKEVRLPCEVAIGCAVDLGLGDAGLAAVHVRFDAMRSGKIDVSSRLEDLTGRASAPQAATLALDRSGFGASHYEASARGASRHVDRRRGRQDHHGGGSRPGLDRAGRRSRGLTRRRAVRPDLISCGRLRGARDAATRRSPVRGRRRSRAPEAVRPAR